MNGRPPFPSSKRGGFPKSSNANANFINCLDAFLISAQYVGHSHSEAGAAKAFQIVLAVGVVLDRHLAFDPGE